MDFNIKEIKKRARADIKGQIGKCFIVSLITIFLALISEVPALYMEPELASMLPPLNVSTGFLSGLSAIFLLLVIIPISVGTWKFYLKLAKKEDAKVSDIFYYDNLKQTLGSDILYGLAIGAVVAIYTLLMWFALESGYVSGICQGILVIVAVVFYVYFLIMVGFGLSQTLFVICEEITTGFTDPLEISFAMMKGEKWNLFKLSLSFIWWYFLVIVTAGIASIYVVPYVNAASAEFYLYLKEKKFENEDNYSIEEF